MNGWFKACRTAEALEVIKKNQSAFILAFMIAWRARYCDGFNADGLERGEAMLGDFESYGMSQRQYRTAKKQLASWKFATFKTTNRGTIGKLNDTRLFDPTSEATDKQNGKQPTAKRQSGGEQPTTNKKEKKERNEEMGDKEQPTPSIAPSPAAINLREFSQTEKISKEKELDRATRELASYGKASDHDKGSKIHNRIMELRSHVEKLRSELGVVA